MTKPANDNAAWDARKLQAEIAGLLQQYPELAEDEDLRADTLEGVGLDEVLSKLVGAAQDAKFMATATADRIGELQARKSMFERRNEAMRTLLFRVLKAADLPRRVLPEATVSIGKGRDKVEITDESKLPKWALRVTTSPDKTAIKERLDAGKKVPGAEILTGGETLTLRVA